MYNVTNHAKERYAARIMGRDNVTDIRKFINDHDNDITVWINELIQYGQLLYEGNIKDYPAQQVYMKDRWVVIVDHKKNNVVTLYKVDLGDDEVSELFISKMLDKIDVAKNNVENIKDRVKDNIELWQEQINVNRADIDHFKKQIKDMEKVIDAYDTLVKNANAEVRQANYDVQTLVEQLICRRQF